MRQQFLFIKLTKALRNCSPLQEGILTPLIAVQCISMEAAGDSSSEGHRVLQTSAVQLESDGEQGERDSGTLAVHNTAQKGETAAEVSSGPLGVEAAVASTVNIAKICVSTELGQSGDSGDEANFADVPGETEPLNGHCREATEDLLGACGVGDATSNAPKGGESIWLLYLSRAFTAWGDRLWAFGLGMFLFRIRPESLFLMAGYGLARSLTSILLDAALGAWIDRTGRLRSVFIFICSI